MKFFSHEELIHFIETVLIIIIIRTVSFPPSHRFCAISMGSLGGGGWFFLVGGCFSKGGRGGPPPRFQELISTTGSLLRGRKVEGKRERKEGRRERKKRFLVMAVLFYSN